MVSTVRVVSLSRGAVRLRQLLELMTVYALARELGVSRQSIMAWRDGEAVPRESFRVRLHDASMKHLPEGIAPADWDEIPAEIEK